MQINNDCNGESKDMNDIYVFFFEDSSIDENDIYQEFFPLLDEDENNQDSKYYFTCKNCKNIPKISFSGIDKFNIECDCSHGINVDKKDLKEKYLINEDKDLDKNFSKSRKCRKHSLEYHAHCFDCSKDICEQCLSEEEELHETHEMLIYPNFYQRYKKILDNVSPKMDGNCLDMTDIIKIFEIILKDYTKFPNYNSYKNLNNGINFLEKLNGNDRELYHRENREKEFYTKIRSSRELKDILNNDDDFINDKIKIESIKINSQNFFDLKPLKLKNLQLNNYPHLITLDLNQNNIADIETLSSIKFPELKYLNLSKNIISDESIEIIPNLNCPKLKYLNLSDNAFTKYEIFKSFEYFEDLESIYIGNNLFNKDLKNIKKKNLNFKLPQNLKELDASYGVFSNKSINILNNIKLDNLKKLNLSWNNLISLSFLEIEKFWNLEEVHLSNNYLIEFKKLRGCKGLKIINLKKNKINDINNLNEFLKEFPNIEKMILIDNNIDLDDIENEKIINKAKKHRNSSNDKIQIFF